MRVEILRNIYILGDLEIFTVATQTVEMLREISIQRVPLVLLLIRCSESDDQSIKHLSY